MRAAPTAVYVVVSRRGSRAKIGASSRPRRRGIEVAWASFAPGSRLVKVWDRPKDALLVERVAHWQLAELHEGNEWFDVDADRAIAAVEAAIAKVDAGDVSADEATKRVPRRSLARSHQKAMGEFNRLPGGA